MIELEKNAKNDAMNMYYDLATGKGDDSNVSHDDTAVLLGASIPIKNSIRPIKFPEVLNCYFSLNMS